METLTTPDWIEEATRRIADRFDPVRIVLFGSHARGDADEESDIDLFIEMETPLSPPERAIEVAALFGLRPWSMDLVVYTPDEVNKLQGVSGTLLSQIEREGKVLYEKA